MILADGLPPTSAWIYFVLHLLAGATHLIAALMVLSPLAKRFGLSTRTRVAGVVAHGGSAFLHGFLGVNSFFGWSTRNADGTVPPHSMAIVAAIAIGLPLYLYLAQRDVLGPRKGPERREYPR